MSSGTTEIGYLCHHGHYCFHADPDEGGQCGTKRVGTITLTFDDTDVPEDWTEIVADAQASLAEKYDTWRKCKCDSYGFLSDGSDDGATPSAAEFKRVRKIVAERRADEDYMCPNCVTPWKCNGPHLDAECPRCYEPVVHEDAHLRGDKNVNCWYECPEDDRPTA